MSKKIRILPGGREFVSEGNSNLLEAGLSAGLALGYGCSNGNCGECVARVVSGEVKKTRHHDYRISNEENAGNQILMCCNTAVSDVVLEAIEAQNTSEIPQQHITAKVKDIRFANENVALVHLKTPRSNRLRFLAGQYVQLGGNDIPVAEHSISSCPCDDMNLHFQLPRLPGDAFSDYVFNGMKKGDPVDVNGPGGAFVLDEKSTRPLVFIAWQTGFGPIKSLVEHGMSLEITETMHLVWITGTKDDRFLDNLCRSWQDALDNFNYLPVDTGDTEGSIDVGQLLTRQLNIKPAKLDDYDFYIAGNRTVLDACRKTLIGCGLPAEQLTLDPLEHT